MGFLKSVGHFFKHDIGRGANKFFKSGKIDGTKLIGKGSIASKGLSTVSKGLGQASGVLDSVGKVAGTILNNPITQGALGVIAPEALVGADALQAGLKVGSGALKQGSSALKQKNYTSGNIAKVAGNVLERAISSAQAPTPTQAVASASMGQPTNVSQGGQTYTMM
jgi:hypothetical protein